MKKILTLLALMLSASAVANAAEIKSSYTAIAIGAREPGKGTGTVVMRISKKGPADAENRALRDCRSNGGIKCRIMQTSVNMCSAVAIGKMKDGKKVRLYGIKLSESDKSRQRSAHRFNSKTHPGKAIYQNLDDAKANALRQCKRDSTVDPDSCKVQFSDCGLTYKG